MTPTAIRDAVLTLHAQNRSLRDISRALKLSRNTVRRILRPAPEADDGSSERVPVAYLKSAFARAQGNVSRMGELLAAEYEREVSYSTLTRWVREAGLRAPPERAESLMEIARRSRATPRTANYLLKRARDFADVNQEPLTVKTIKKALALLEIDEIGLNQTDRDILTIIVENFHGGPVGLKSIAASLSEEDATIEEVHEPYLMQIGLIERTPRGRTVTKRGYEHMGFEISKGMM